MVFTKFRHRWLWMNAALGFSWRNSVWSQTETWAINPTIVLWNRVRVQFTHRRFFQTVSVVPLVPCAGCWLSYCVCSLQKMPRRCRNSHLCKKRRNPTVNNELFTIGGKLYTFNRPISSSDSCKGIILLYLFLITRVRVYRHANCSVRPKVGTTER